MIRKFIFAFQEFNNSKPQGEGEFLAVMASPEFQHFADDGYFAPGTNPFDFNYDTTFEYIEGLGRKLESFQTLLMMHLIYTDDDIRTKYLPVVTNRIRERLENVSGFTKTRNNPNIIINLLTDLGINVQALAIDTSRYFSFKFSEAIFAADRLTWALRNEVADDYKELQKELLISGPDVLRRIARVYDVMDHYFCDNPGMASAQADYPEIAEKLKMMLYSTADFMQQLLDRHPEQLAGVGINQLQ